MYLNGTCGRMCIEAIVLHYSTDVHFIFIFFQIGTFHQNTCFAVFDIGPFILISVISICTKYGFVTMSCLENQVRCNLIL